MTTQPNVNITLKDQRLFIFDELQRVNCTSDVDGSNYCMQSSIYNDMVEWAREIWPQEPTKFDGVEIKENMPPKWQALLV